LSLFWFYAFAQDLGEGDLGDDIVAAQAVLGGVVAF